MGFLDDMMEAGKGVAEQQAGQMLERLGQDVLDSVIDKLLVSCADALQEAGLDPLHIPDIKVPYSLDKMTGLCAPLLQDASSPIAKLVGQLLSCLAKNISLEGQLLLSDGLLSGLSSLARHQATQITVTSGEARLAASLAFPALSCPFTVTNSNSEVEIPQMEARVEQIVATFSLVIPLSRGGGSTRELTFLPPLEELPVMLDMDLGELGPLEDIIRPLIVEPVRQKLVAALREEVTRIVREKVQEVGLASLLG